MKNVKNKLKMYIDDLISRLSRFLENEADAVLWIQKNVEAQAFLMRGLELDQLRHLSDSIAA